MVAHTHKPCPGEVVAGKSEGQGYTAVASLDYMKKKKTHMFGK